MISHEIETFLTLYDRCIRFGIVGTDDFSELVAASREIAVLQPIDACTLIAAMVERMAARMGQSAEPSQQQRNDRHA